MANKNIIQKLKCFKCGWKWFPRVPDPVKCPNPKCQSTDWNKKKRS